MSSISILSHLMYNIFITIHIYVILYVYYNVNILLFLFFALTHTFINLNYINVNNSKYKAFGEHNIILLQIKNKKLR